MSMQETAQPLRIVLHAPSAGALTRARNNAKNILADAPAAQVSIVANADGVAAALDQPSEFADPLTLLCPNTLAKLARVAQPPFVTLKEGAVLAIARMQIEGWIYIRS